MVLHTAAFGLFIIAFVLLVVKISFMVTSVVIKACSNQSTIPQPRPSEMTVYWCSKKFFLKKKVKVKRYFYSARQCWGKAAPRLWRSLLQWGHIFESVSCSNDHHNPPPFLSQAHPNHLENQPTQNSSSYGLFSLESTYILITIKLQVIKLLRECTLSDFDIINNYLHNLH